MNTKMKNRRRFLTILLLAGLVQCILFSGCVFRESKASEIEEGFIPLFNGKNLDGWHLNSQNNVHGTGGSWKVRDGVLTCEQDPPGSGNGGILMTDQEYGDFELLLEVAPDWGVDSGVFLRTNPQGECIQIYVDHHDNGNIGSISTETSDGKNRMFIRPFTIFGKFNNQGVLSGFTTEPDKRDIAWKPDYLIYSATPEAWMSAWKIGEWNTLRIRCVGEYPHITTWINNTKIVEFDGTSCPQPNYDKDKLLQKLGRKGAISLQVHRGTASWPKGAKCRWRNIRIKPL